MNHLWAAVLAVALAPGAVRAAEPVRVEVDTVTVLQLSGEAQTVYLANPVIADVTPVASNKLFVLGRRPGRSNLIVLDPQGQEILNTPILVRPQGANSVTVNRGTQTRTLTCSPRCVDLGGSASAPAPAIAIPAPARP